MTVIAAFDDGDKYWIASDSMGSAGGMKYELGSKLIARGNYVIGFSWSYRIADIIKECGDLPATMNGIRDLRVLRDIIQSSVLKDGLLGNGDSDEGKRRRPHGHPIDIVIASPKGIFTLESDYQIHKVPDGYIACGSGTEIAMGVLYSCQALDVFGKDAVTLAVKAASKHITTCGGKCFVKSVEKK